MITGTVVLAALVLAPVVLAVIVLAVAAPAGPMLSASAEHTAADASAVE